MNCPRLLRLLIDKDPFPPPPHWEEWRPLILKSENPIRSARTILISFCWRSSHPPTSPSFLTSVTVDLSLSPLRYNWPRRREGASQAVPCDCDGALGWREPLRGELSSPSHRLGEESVLSLSWRLQCCLFGSRRECKNHSWENCVVALVCQSRYSMIFSC
jgi:hypothetical protein